ncbi:hypothetical protein Q7A53_05540 [Halobacillus rhizosphaerae]|uniref:hypothetical protein n=1 Tax=Halobacillus rhizosphaerae TaxID=3064889 RepID=UPI00398B2C53
MKYNVGQEVEVRTDLITGQMYRNEEGTYSEIFQHNMRAFKGQKTKVTGIVAGGYKLEVSERYVFTDNMLKLPTLLEEKPYVFNRENNDHVELEKLLDHMLKLVPDQLINDAISRGDRKAFEEISRRYYDFSE